MTRNLRIEETDRVEEIEAKNECLKESLQDILFSHKVYNFIFRE